MLMAAISSQAGGGLLHLICKELIEQTEKKVAFFKKTIKLVFYNTSSLVIIYLTGRILPVFLILYGRTLPVGACHSNTPRKGEK